MALQVYLKVPFLCEGLPTEVTLEGLDTEVFSDVDLQTRFLRV